MFIAEFIPQVFIDVCSILVTVKALLLVLVNKDTYSSYIEKKNRRLKIAAYVTAPIYVLLFLYMNQRFTVTCYRNLTEAGNIDSSAIAYFISWFELPTEY